MRYVSFIHRDAAGYGVSFPDFPGCVSVGDTVDDAVRHGSEALAFHVDGLLDDGEAIPSPRSIDAIKADPELADWRHGADLVLIRYSWIAVARGVSTSPSTAACSKRLTTRRAVAGSHARLSSRLRRGARSRLRSHWVIGKGRDE